MIKFYAYYNFGGYKDLYLGSLTDTDEYKYFLPLLAIREKELEEKPTPELAKELDTLRSLPPLICLTEKSDEYSYPPAVRRMITHAGYKVLYKEADRDTMALGLRDVPGEKDNYGRETKFSFVIVAEGQEDIKKTDRIAEHIKNNIDTVSGMLTELFTYDFETNGLRFNMAKLNSEITEIIDNEAITVPESDSSKTVKLIVIPQSETIDNACKTQNISKKDIQSAFYTGGIEINLPRRHHYEEHFGHSVYARTYEDTDDKETPVIRNDEDNSLEQRVKILEEQVAVMSKMIKDMAEKIYRTES